MPVFDAIIRLFGSVRPDVRAGLMLTAAYIAAAVLYRFVELPFMRLRDSRRVEGLNSRKIAERVS